MERESLLSRGCARESLQLERCGQGEEGQEPTENVRDGLSSPKLSLSPALGTRFACILGPCVCTSEPAPDSELSRACADFYEVGICFEYGLK